MYGHEHVNGYGRAMSAYSENNHLKAATTKAVCWDHYEKAVNPTTFAKQGLKSDPKTEQTSIAVNHP